MDCEKYIVMMNMLIDGELSSEERKELSRHISECPDCAKRLRQFKMIKEETKQLTAELPPSFHETIMNRIKREEAEKKTRIARKIFSLCAAACIVVVFALVAAPKFSKLYLFAGSDKGASGGSVAEAVSASLPTASDTYAEEADGVGKGTAASEPSSALSGKDATGGTGGVKTGGTGGASLGVGAGMSGGTAAGSQTDPGAYDSAPTAVQQNAGSLPGAVRSSALKLLEGFSAYYAFYGDCPVPDSFSADDMRYFPQDNETYLFVKNADIENALSAMTAAGFKMIDYPFPEPEKEKEKALIVFFGDK